MSDSIEIQSSISVLQRVMDSYKFRHYGLGWINKRRIKRIVPKFKAGLESNPNDEQIRLALGKSLQLLHRHEEALIHFEYLAHSRPENPEYQLEQATQLIYLERNEEANDLLQHVRRLTGNTGDLLQRYAGLMIVLDKDDEAQSAIEEAFAHNPDNKHLQTLSEIILRIEQDEIYRPDLYEIQNAWRVTNYLSDNARVTLGMGE